ncbi:conserved Plasmodium protein, unknown function [Plasmodium knowlesi strain H]|uniref:Uncharacterized protein n=3 Tax=Plasmodium knowlesi TaxID=5850 RepID=A0A5K1UTR9_PLAKH|nr:conserved Plasmodium protein, unknown function [Plasmodium knowlesi strain H]OTN65414.1 Uncharacterized protein PKNOH_S110086400 [Plasmodium knowlesi]CAA9989485.1 conserved Plasmodium protein, unknown function [Plasmodium knowlesi strain H]SBO25153.1 conserved Plasmodium protein, unknown function [Plasmodium knowlesi strain H]SBO27787.1 conserved Plasmodium protein, unknown function [Plasmodium knowlesi strain H]VVS78959.1 conserved Plasmodium protein, unknown function [Plasmodium knowlesi |eukprot:XP_002260210.1 hypothetical protein, conserved in Plasmodium species [Plasmodium knowlesi strain H]
MIRKRKSKVAENEQVEVGKEEELMEGQCVLTKKDSAMKCVEEISEKGREEVNYTKIKESGTLETITYASSPKDSAHVREDKSSVRNCDEMKRRENSMHDEITDKEENIRSSITLEQLNYESSPSMDRSESQKNEEMKFKGIDELCNKYDKEVQNLLEIFDHLSFSWLFKNPFCPTISRDEKIVRIFYYSGFSLFPYLGWVIASIFGSFCKERNNKNIVSLRIISSIQCAFFGFMIVLIMAVINMNNRSALQCKYEGISIKKKLVKDSKYNVVFFGPMSTDDWMSSRVAKIAEDLQFNVYTISYPNIKNRLIKRKRHVFLKDALACAKLKYSRVILFSFQIESAVNFTIPFLERSQVLGFLSYSKKYPKKAPMLENEGQEKIIYFTPDEKNLYDIYISLRLRICKNEQKKYYNILHIIHHSFNKYRIRCAQNLAEDYSITVNNFNFNTTGVENKGEKYEDEDFKEVIDDFYQYLAFIRDIISQNNLEFYRKMLCENTMCDSKGSVCVL